MATFGWQQLPEFPAPTYLPSRRRADRPRRDASRVRGLPADYEQPGRPPLRGGGHQRLRRPRQDSGRVASRRRGLHRLRHRDAQPVLREYYLEQAHGAKFPKAVAKITEDAGELLAFYDYQQHWIHLRTANPIEPAFATVRHRTKVTKGPAPELPTWRWHSSSSRPPKTAGARSAHPDSSRSSAPVHACQRQTPRTARRIRRRYPRRVTRPAQVLAIPPACQAKAQ